MLLNCVLSIHVFTFLAYLIIDLFYLSLFCKTISKCITLGFCPSTKVIKVEY